MSDTDFQRKSASLVEEMQRRLQARIDLEVMGALTADMQGGGFVHWDPPQEPFDLGRLVTLMQQMRDTPGLRFQRTSLIPARTMFKVMEGQRDLKTQQAYQLVLIHPDDVPAARAAFLEQLAGEPSILRPILPQGLEPEGPTTPEEREVAQRWLESLP